MSRREIQDMQLHTQPLSKHFRFVAIVVAILAVSLMLSLWLGRAWQQWQIVRELEGQGIRIYLSGMAVPQAKQYSRLSDFAAPLPADEGTWRDFARHLFFSMTALDFTHYAGLNDDMTPFEPRLSELLDRLPQVHAAVGWQGPCGCCLTVEWCPTTSKYGPIEHRPYTFDMHFRRQLTEARREKLLAAKQKATRE
jgi:hypothetical protein